MKQKSNRQPKFQFGKFWWVKFYKNEETGTHLKGTEILCCILIVYTTTWGDILWWSGVWTAWAVPWMRMVLKLVSLLPHSFTSTFLISSNNWFFSTPILWTHYALDTLFSWMLKFVQSCLVIKWILTGGWLNMNFMWPPKKNHISLKTCPYTNSVYIPLEKHIFFTFISI